MTPRKIVVPRHRKFVAKAILYATAAFLVSCSGDANFNAPTKTRRDDALVPGETGQNGPSPAASSPNYRVESSREVASPNTLTFGSGFEISANSEVPPTKLPQSPDAIVIKGEFPASKKIEGTLRVDAPEKSFSTAVTLEQVFSPEKDTYTQAERPILTETRTQGNPGMAKTQTFAQADMGIVDIQVVVDNSGSMSQEQQKMKTRLGDLLSYIGGSQWQINVINTTSGDPCSRGIIKKGDVNAASRFASAVDVGTNGSSIEEGIRRAVEGLQCTAPTPWVRPNSRVVVLIASDEDNCSNGVGCEAQYRSENYLLNYLSNTLQRPLGSAARVYGIVGKPLPDGTKHPDVKTIGSTYLSAVARTGGYAGEISDSDYAMTFQEISRNIATILETKFTLEAAPDPQSLQVRINGTLVPPMGPTGAVNWEMDPGNPKVVAFKAVVPQYSDRITMNYTVGQRGTMTKTFNLSQVPHVDPNSMFIVYVNGNVAQQGIDYLYDGIINSIVFAAEPPAGAEIRILYKKSTILPTKFKLAKSPAEGKKIQALVNGAASFNFSYDAASGELVFASAPPEASKIEVEYQRLVGPLTRYPLVLMGNQTQSPQIFYEKTKLPVVGAKIEGNTLIVSETGFLPGEKVIIKYFNETSGLYTVTLPKKALNASINVKSSEGSCTATLSASALEVSLNCTGFGAKIVDLTYSYQSEPDVTYTLKNVANPDAGQWTVTIDGVKTTEFTRQGSVITLNQPPLPTAIVTIEYRDRT